jgi:hypothetical protein
MKLIFVTYTNDDGDNFDLFVWADTIGEAKRLWREYYSLDDDEEPRFMHSLPFIPMYFEPTPRAFKWHDEIVLL